MGIVALLWRLVRRRWLRRALVWLAVRLFRRFGWRRAVKLLFRGRHRWRFLALGAWRAAMRVLRFGRAVFLLVGWSGAHASRPITQGRRAALRSAISSRRRRERRTDTPWLAQLRHLKPRVAHRRDEVRRSVLARMGVDPNWRPAQRRRLDDVRASAPQARPELADKAS